MPTRENSYEYAANATYGNVAYDLNRYGNAQPAPEIEYPAESERRPEIRPVRRAVAVEETKQGLSLFAMAGFGVLTVLMVLVLMAYVQLTAINSEATALRNQLAEAREAEAQLEIKYENVFDLENVEEYAVNTLGMVKLADDQITVLENMRADKAEMLSNNGRSGGVLRMMLTAVLEYFR